MYPNKVYIALGTNLGNWKNNFNQALKFISKLGTIDKIGSIYLSKPYGFDNQNYFYNTAIEFSTSLSPHFLQISLQLIELAEMLHRMLILHSQYYQVIITRLDK